MVKKITLVPFAFFLFLINVAFLNLSAYAQIDSVSQQKIPYDLPYPGILPDHPFYVIKALRDYIIDWTTRDYLKKAQLYLLYSDKRTAMTLELAKKGKEQLAITTFSKAEKYFLQIPPLLQTSKEQGVSPPADFISRLKLSNARHREVGETLIKELPQGETQAINEVLKINKEIQNELRRW